LPLTLELQETFIS